MKKQWKVTLEFMVYDCENVDDVRAVLPIITSSHEPMHTDILPEASIVEISGDEDLDTVAEDTGRLVPILIKLDEDLMKTDDQKWELSMMNGNRFVWIRPKEKN